MREFLSQCGVTYDERNIAADPAARGELEARIGTVLVPTLVRGSDLIVGYDPQAMQRLLAGDGAAAGGAASVDTGFDGLPREDCPPRDTAAGTAAGLVGSLRVFLDHLEHELRVNAAKGNYAYRHGVHDGLRFAADGLRKILDDDELPNSGRRALPGQLD